MKNLRKSNLFTTCLAMLVSFSVIGFVGCEKEIFDYGSNYLEIEGNLNDPKTLLDRQNSKIFIEASIRMREHLTLKNNQLSLGISSGASINISEELFNYIKSNYQLTNDKLSKNILFAYEDENNGIRISSRSGLRNSIIRLKSNATESDDEKTDLSSMSDQEILESLYEFARSGNGGALNDYYDLDAIDWDTDGIGSASIQGTGIINGRRAMYTLQNGCYYTGDNDCDFNDVGAYDGDSNYDWVRNVDGLPIVSIWYY